MTGPTDRLRASEFLLLAAELAVILLLLYSYRIEQDFGLTRILPLVFGGFLVHAWIPLRYRLPFFLALSLVAIVVVLSPMQAAALVIMGLALIGICHLPAPFGARVALLILVGIFLAAIRGEWILIPWKTIPSFVLPVLAAMFMFRLVVYMYDLRHEKGPVSIWKRLSYFFLLPNVCFLLFPVVDYKTFLRTYYDADQVVIYQKGIRWMFRGVLHLLIYRIVYLYLVIPPHEVTALADVARYTTSFWLLYVRISGQFHLVVGMLCLFGFNLPETNRRYYLASSFTDLWRRANIYWKDFMQKVFYYPMYTRLKRFGSLTGVLLATIAIFVVTWLLHSYQWFWLRGQFPIRTNDMLFWGVIGVGVVFNVWREMTGSKKSLLRRPAFSFQRATTRAVKVLGMFLAMSILWSLWSSSSFSEWVDVLSAAGNSPLQDYAVLVIALLGVAAAGVAAQYVAREAWSEAFARRIPSSARAAVVVAALSLLVVAQPVVQGRLWGPVGALAASFGYAGQNDVDMERETLGYYEGLLEPTWQSRSRSGERPEDWVTLDATNAVTRTNDLRAIAFRPNYVGSFKLKTLRTNQWGIRDREYERDKPAGTYRIAVLGGSYTMGSGVENDETFENLVEDRFNAELKLDGYERAEILNFSMAGFSVLQGMDVLDRQALAFDPDMVVCVIHMNEDVMVRRALRAAIGQGRSLGRPWLLELIERAGARRGMSAVKVEQLLKPYLSEVIEMAMRTIAETARRNGSVPVAVYVPLTHEDETRSARRRRQVLAMAERAGMHTLSVEDVFVGRDEDSLAIARWDSHPNAFAHRLIADAIFDEVVREGASWKSDAVSGTRPGKEVAANEETR